MIHLTRGRHVGQLLRSLRHDAGLTLVEVGRRAHLTKNGISKREIHDGMSAAGLVDHLDALGHDVVIVKRSRPGARPTGTGWPA